MAHVAENFVTLVDFLARQWSGRHPAPTRVGVRGDWRNCAVFSFDLAMILQGLADAAPVVGPALCAETARRIAPWLDRMISHDGTLMPYLALGPIELPSRWSTRPGAFQMKAATALLSVPPEWLSQTQSAAAQRTLERWANDAAMHRELHARFYALEGLLRDGRPFTPELVLEGQSGDGWFPETIGKPHDFPRADVQAQALRLLCLSPMATEAARDIAASSLLRHVRADGFVSFRIGELEANVWCALFAHQALDWLCWLRGAGSSTPDARRMGQAWSALPVLPRATAMRSRPSL